MCTLVPSRRAVVATALGLAMSLPLVGCSRMAEEATRGGAEATSESTEATREGPEARSRDAPNYQSCSLAFIDGELVANKGQVVLLGWRDRAVPLHWPASWTVRPIDDGQLDVVDDTGTVRARTGAGIVLHAVVDPAAPGTFLFRDDALVVCAGQWPDNYMDPDYVAPDGDAP